MRSARLGLTTIVVAAFLALFSPDKARASGGLYFGIVSSGTEVHQLDPNNNWEPTLVADLADEGLVSINAADSLDGSIYVVDNGPHRLFKINPSTWQIQIWWEFPDITEAISFHPETGLLYYTDGAYGLHTFNLDNGQATAIGFVGSGNHFNGMDFDTNGNLFAFKNNTPTDMFQIHYMDSPPSVVEICSNVLPGAVQSMDIDLLNFVRGATSTDGGNLYQVSPFTCQSSVPGLGVSQNFGALVSIRVQPRGDMDCDGYTNMNDLEYFINALLDPDGYVSPTISDWRGYNGHFYGLTQNEMGWVEADDLAMSLDGHLITINDSLEQDWLTYDSGFIDTSQPLSSNSVWIGLYQLPGSPEPDGNWRWVSGDSSSYANWGVGQPDDSTGNDSYAKLDEHGYGWDDTANNDIRIGIIEAPYQPYTSLPCDVTAADINLDGSVDGRDIQHFLEEVLAE